MHFSSRIFSAALAAVLAVSARRMSKVLDLNCVEA